MNSIKVRIVGKRVIFDFDEAFYTTTVDVTTTIL
jgi:hypothetical protein